VTTITLSGWSAGAVDDDRLQQIVNTFQRTHPGIKVNYDVVGGDYPTAMAARFAAHNPPDVFFLDSSLVSTWAPRLQPLNRYIDASHDDTSKFYPSLLSAFTVGNVVYGLPKDWSPLGMEINTGMLREAGATAPKSWAELRATAQKLAAAKVVDGKPICLPADWARLAPFVFQNGGTLGNIQSPAVAAAVSFYVGLLKEGLAATPDQLGSSWCGEALGKRKAAIVFEGDWLLPFMSSTYPKTRYGVYAMVSQKTGGNVAFTVAYALAKQSKHKQAAWTLLSWLTSRQGITLWATSGRALPSRSDVEALGRGRRFVVAAKYAHGWGFSHFPTAYPIMNRDLSAVISGNGTIAKMLADAAAAMRQ